MSLLFLCQLQKKLILIFFFSEEMVVSVEEIKNIADKTFDFVVRNSAKLAIKILTEQNEEENEEKFKKLVNKIFAEQINLLEKMAEEK